MGQDAGPGYCVMLDGNGKEDIKIGRILGQDSSIMNWQPWVKSLIGRILGQIINWQDIVRSLIGWVKIV